MNCTKLIELLKFAKSSVQEWWTTIYEFAISWWPNNFSINKWSAREWLIRMWLEDTLHQSCLSLMGILLMAFFFYVVLNNQSCHKSHMQTILESQTQVNCIAHKQTITCERLFAGHPLSSRPVTIFLKQEITNSQ